jgi:hypothetical protein
MEGRPRPIKSWPRAATKSVSLIPVRGRKATFRMFAGCEIRNGANRSNDKGRLPGSRFNGGGTIRGRGQIFNRLTAHKKAYPDQVMYFSFYVIANKNHEREVETAILRAAGPQMILNTKKVGDGIEPGDVRDYEPGTEFFERQRIRGRKANGSHKRPKGQPNSNWH